MVVPRAEVGSCRLVESFEPSSFKLQHGKSDKRKTRSTNHVSAEAEGLPVRA